MGENEDKRRRFEKLSRFADEGDRLAMRELAKCYELGEGVERNLGAAIYYYNTAAELGVKDALFDVARFYFEGLGVEENKAKAKKIWLSLVNDYGKSAALDLLKKYFPDEYN